MHQSFALGETADQLALDQWLTYHLLDLELLLGVEGNDRQFLFGQTLGEVLPENVGHVLLSTLAAYIDYLNGRPLRHGPPAALLLARGPADGHVPLPHD